VPVVREPLSRLRRAARSPAPAVGFERLPRRLLVALRAAAAEAAAGAATLALLESAPRACDGVLAELAERERSANMAGREALAARSARIDPTSCAALVAFPAPPGAETFLGVHRRVSEGRRLARRARAIAIEAGDPREVLSRTGAIAAVERALGSSGRAAGALQRLSLS